MKGNKELSIVLNSLSLPCQPSISLNLLSKLIFVKKIDHLNSVNEKLMDSKSNNAEEI